jgi:hypothetical protein
MGVIDWHTPGHPASTGAESIAPYPQPFGASEGSKPALGRDTGACEDEKAVMVLEGHDENENANSFPIAAHL